jgi:hypothetical protein
MSPRCPTLGRPSLDFSISDGNKREWKKRSRSLRLSGGSGTTFPTDLEGLKRFVRGNGAGVPATTAPGVQAAPTWPSPVCAAASSIAPAVTAPSARRGPRNEKTTAGAVVLGRRFNGVWGAGGFNGT